MSKMTYPKKVRMLLVRDCTVAICLNNNPGAVLLSVLLFWYDHPHSGDFYEGEGREETFTLCRTQAEIEVASCHQIDVKTIHDTASPLLALLGFLTLKEKMNGNLYTVHVGRIRAAFAALEEGTLKAYHRSLLQLESALIEMTEDELESALINKRGLYLQIERTLIQIRLGSNCKRGPKPKPKAASDNESANTENLRESLRESIPREREGAAIADATPAHDISVTNVSVSDSQNGYVTQAKGVSDDFSVESAVPHVRGLDGTPLRVDTQTATGLAAQAVAPDYRNIIPPRLTLSAKGVSSNGVLVGDREGQLDRDRGADGAVFPVAAVGRQDVSLARAQVGSPTDCREASAPMEAATQHTPVRASPSSLSLSSCDAPSTAHSHTVGDPLPIVPSLPAKAPERGDWEASGEPPDTVAAGRSRTGEKPRRGKPPAKSDEALPSLTEDELAFWNEWCSQFKTAPPLGPKTIEAVKRMRAPVTTWAGVLGVERAALMKDIRLWIHAQDKKKFYSRGIRFTDFDREFENWQEAKQFEIDLNTPPDSYADNDYSLPAQLWRQEQRFREQPDSLSILLGARVPPLMEVP